PIFIHLPRILRDPGPLRPLHPLRPGPSLPSAPQAAAGCHPCSPHTAEFALFLSFFKAPVKSATPYAPVFSPNRFRLRSDVFAFRFFGVVSFLGIFTAFPSIDPSSVVFFGGLGNLRRRTGLQCGMIYFEL
ncbi:hypothetical protein PIB30_080940, partial [Stylosanthes scabra]|nr:hypothetical protein [Stylosanthes scabra]